MASIAVDAFFMKNISLKRADVSQISRLLGTDVNRLFFFRKLLEKGGHYEEQVEVKFPKNGVLQSQRYREYRNLLSTVLEDGKNYTAKEIDSMIEKFQKGKVR